MPLAEVRDQVHQVINTGVLWECLTKNIHTKYAHGNVNRKLETAD